MRTNGHRIFNQHTKTIERRACNHECITLSLCNSLVVLLCKLVGANEKPEAQDTNEYTLDEGKKILRQTQRGKRITYQELGPMIFRSKVDPWKQQANWDGPSVDKGKTRECGGAWMTYASSSMQDSKSVYSYALTTIKLPSTSHAARMRSDSGWLSLTKQMTSGTYISSHRAWPSQPILWNHLSHYR
jgi:hypothetical protein